MPATAPALPTRFPCWCKATYSWGGETKRDLGFIEGDLIECLNAGDGSWWTGRLKRDRRMCGLFPSNFVVLLPESQWPGSRSVSPMPSRNNSGASRLGAASPNPVAATASPAKQKSVFRKPFSSMAQPQHLAVQSEAGSVTSNTSKSKHRPFSSMKAMEAQPKRQDSGASNARNNRPISPAPPPRAELQARLRARSPAPHALSQVHSRAVSPAPYASSQVHSRAVSPAPSFDYRPHSRMASPVPFQEASPPPPAPPPHRVAYNPSRAPSPQPYDSGYDTPEGHSPVPPSPGFRKHTPSPFTNAMNDVMSSLQDMSIPQQYAAPLQAEEPPSVWSPEAFDQFNTTSARQPRALTSMGIVTRQEEQYEEAEQEDFDAYQDDGPPEVSTYVHRMENRLRLMQQQQGPDSAYSSFAPDDTGPPPPRKNSPLPPSDHADGDDFGVRDATRRALKNRKSAYELGREALNRTFTTKTTSTSTTQSTNHSLMSGASAGAFSATSAGSLAKRKFGRKGSVKGRPMSVMETRSFAGSRLGLAEERPESPFTGVTYHSSHASRPSVTRGDSDQTQASGTGPLGGLYAPKAKKSGFFKKMTDTFKTSAATARSTIASRAESRSGSRPASRAGNALNNGITGIAGGMAAPASSAARDMGLGGTNDWVQVRRDVNRSNSLSKNERQERAERCEMHDIPVINPVDELRECVEGDEGLDGLPVVEPMDFSNCNLALVDKNARFISNLPPMMNPASLAQGYVCRPYRSDVQRLRAIFTWVSERIAWEEDFEGSIDLRRVIQAKRGSSEEIAVLVLEMCSSVGLHAEVIRGYLKSPGEMLDLDMVARPNHFWNAVIVDGEWRIMDCALANPTNPRRSWYSSASSQVAEGWWFLARPTEICYTHVPLLPEQQHICPPVPHEVLMALPLACPPFFKNNLSLSGFDTAMLHLENLEMAQVHVSVPEDVECIAEVEAKAYARDADGDFFESGDVVTKRALAQADWIDGVKHITIKALLPGDEGQATLKVYAGKRGLRHSTKTNPHPLTFTLPLTHTGQNPPYEFLTLHPTPHAQRHDLYVAQPQCSRLAVNNTFVFAVRQHPSSLSGAFSASPETMGGVMADAGRRSPNPFARPPSAMSVASISASGSAYSNPASQTSSSSNGSNPSGAPKPAKLAIQTPSGKIIRLTRRGDDDVTTPGRLGGTWETIIKIGERGAWRGLVLADRSARWCVFAEWEAF